MKSFPIFCLPHVALKHVILQMDLLEQIDLSLCSKRSRFAMKSLFRSNSFSIIALFLPNPLIIIKNRLDQKLTLDEEYLISKSYLLKQPTPNNLDPIAKSFLTKDWCDYVSEIFNSHITVISVLLEQFPTDLIDWVGRRQKFAKGCLLNGFKIQNQDYKSYLDSVSDTRMLKVGVSQNKTFEYNGNFNQKDIEIINAEWITMANLLSMTNASYIDLRHSSWCDKDVNQFIKLWIQGSLPKLEHFSIGLKYTNWLEVIAGFELKILISAEHSYKDILNHEHRMSGGLEIKREDGMEAVLNSISAGDSYWNRRIIFVVKDKLTRLN